MKYRKTLTVLIICCHTIIGSTVAAHGNSILSDSLKSFVVTPYRVGNIRPNMSLNNIYQIYGREYVKRWRLPEQEKPKQNIYDIYDSDFSPLLQIKMENQDAPRLHITEIRIKDSRFATPENIRIGSTLQETVDTYKNHSFISSEGKTLALYVPSNNIFFILNPADIKNRWWDSEHKQIISDSIPLDTKISGIYILWDDVHYNVISTGFWKQYFQDITQWIKNELPSLILIIALLIISLKVFRGLIRKIKKQSGNYIDKKSATPIEDIKRVNTISGVIKNIGNVAIWTVFTLILLGKFNINIGPLLAGAGIIGFAIGFGTQELIKDYVSGFFIIMENQIRTGDTVIINGITGVVEKIHIRTTTLRDVSGTVHIFQNGKISSLSNMTKEWSAAVIEIGVAYKENTDHVAKVLSQVGEDMQKSPEWRDKILEPLEILGVDKFLDNAVSIKLKIKTKSGMQWSVMREFQRRTKIRFEREGIQIPFPQIVIHQATSS